MDKIKIELMDSLGDSERTCVAGALGCFEEKSSSQIGKELAVFLIEHGEEAYLKKIAAVLKNSFGRGHGSVGDQSDFVFSVEGLPRSATLFLCLPEYLEHLQQSLRRAKPEQGFYIPPEIANSAMADKAQRTMEYSFKLYDLMTKSGIPGEDARYLLPLNTRTNIQTKGNARELSHLLTMCASEWQMMPNVVFQVIKEMILEAGKNSLTLFANYAANHELLAWYPSSQLYARRNITMDNLTAVDSPKAKNGVVLLGHEINSAITRRTLESGVRGREEAELANLKHVHFEFLAAMSLACFHQATRQRTWNQSVEPIYSAVKSDLQYGNRMYIPSSIGRSVFREEYTAQHRNLMTCFKELVALGVPESEAIGVVPHSLVVWDWIHVNGWNAIHAIGKRTCKKAQLEIRRIAWKMAQKIKRAAPIFDGFVQPQCVIYGKCPEIDGCGYGDRMKNKV